MREYEFNVSDLSGEEMMILDDILTDILQVNCDDEEMDFCSECEEYHEKKYNDYLKTHPDYVPHFDGTYESDMAWMFAEGCVLSKHINAIDNNMIENYLWGRGSYMEDEAKAVWDKVVTVKEKDTYEGPDYSCCDRYDFSMCR